MCTSCHCSHWSNRHHKTNHDTISMTTRCTVSTAAIFNGCILIIALDHNKDDKQLFEIDCPEAVHKKYGSVCVCVCVLWRVGSKK